jgi:hypothetical protein
MNDGYPLASNNEDRRVFHGLVMGMPKPLELNYIMLISLVVQLHCIQYPACNAYHSLLLSSKLYTEGEGSQWHASSMSYPRTIQDHPGPFFTCNIPLPCATPAQEAPDLVEELST